MSRYSSFLFSCNASCSFLSDQSSGFSFGGGGGGGGFGGGGGGFTFGGTPKGSFGKGAFGKGLGKGGKGGKGLGKGGAMRHRKVLRDNIQGISKPMLKRLARRGGIKRLSGMRNDPTVLLLPLLLPTGFLPS
tara:strand:- start:469 stop:864 length:396 start_codon:yes stop_codon:yes gene_type:complete